MAALGLGHRHQQQDHHILSKRPRPEHVIQLGNMSIYCHEPSWTVHNTKNIEKEYTEWLNVKKDLTENVRAFSKQSFGRVATNAIGVTHKMCRVGESSCALAK